MYAWYPESARPFAEQAERLAAYRGVALTGVDFGG
jgi:hypothetical protein